MTERLLKSGLLKTGRPIDVAVIGGGPAGLAAATALKRANVARVVVLEREVQAGGIPRHCGHPPFGMREFGRILSGPAYAARLVAQARRAGVEIHTSASVIEARPGGNLLVACPECLLAIAPRRVIYATGVREKPRSARLISGMRVQGVLNTGALQSMVYLKTRRPFLHPVIIGSELVAFSAIMTSRHAGIHPVAMIEANKHITARWPSGIFPRLAGVRLLTATRLLEIRGETSVRAVVVEGPDGHRREIACDGVVLSGQFIPESALARSGHIAVDPATGGPVVDQWGRCSDLAYFATGNLLRPVETAGWSWAEGHKTGQWVAEDLARDLAKPSAKPSASLCIKTGAGLKYVMPQRLTQSTGGMRDLQFRVAKSLRGEMIALNGKTVVWRKRIKARPERRLLVPVAQITGAGITGTLEFSVRED